MNKNCGPEHDPGTCHQCKSLRHPSKAATRRALAGLPRQTRVSRRQSGGGC